MKTKFRKMNAEEISLRLDTIDRSGVILIPYADSRVYMDILDEGVGPMNWGRHQKIITVDGADCMISAVSVYDDERKIWIEKEDVGVAGETERPKAMSSDSFKRACVNFGIGRELYRSPSIKLSRDNFNISETDGRETTYDKCIVSAVDYGEDGNFIAIEITNLTTNRKMRWNKRLESESSATTTETRLVENVVTPVLKKPDISTEESPAKEELPSISKNLILPEEKPKVSQEKKKTVSSKKAITPVTNNSSTSTPISQPIEASDGQMEFGKKENEITSEEAKKLLVDVGGNLIKQGKTLGELTKTQLKWVYENTKNPKIKIGCLTVAKADENIRKFMISCGIPI